MVAARDIRLAEAAIGELHAQGKREQAASLNAILAAATATAAPPGRAADSAEPGHWTIRQAARASAVPVALIREWIAGGQLPAAIRGGQTLVSSNDLWACIESLPQAPTPLPAPTELAARRQQHERLVADQPADKVARQEALIN